MKNQLQQVQVKEIPDLFSDNVFVTMAEYKADGLEPKHAFIAASHLHRKWRYETNPNHYIQQFINNSNKRREGLPVDKLADITHWAE